MRLLKVSWSRGEYGADGDASECRTEVRRCLLSPWEVRKATTNRTAARTLCGENGLLVVAVVAVAASELDAW